MTNITKHEAALYLHDEINDVNLMLEQEALLLKSIESALIRFKDKPLTKPRGGSYSKYSSYKEIETEYEIVKLAMIALRSYLNFLNTKLQNPLSFDVNTAMNETITDKRRRIIQTY